MGSQDFDYLFLLEHLNDEDRNILKLNTTKVQYSKGERIIKQGEFVSNAIFIITGLVKINVELKNKEIIINIIGKDKLIGLSSMLSFEKHQFSINALEDTSVFQISINTLRELIEKNGKFAQQMIDYINHSNIEYINHNLLSLTQNNIHGRIANSLLYLSEKVFCNPKFEIMLSRKELASFSKVSRENVIKTLYEFNSEGLIRLNKKEIEILNLEKLKKMAQFS